MSEATGLPTGCNAFDQANNWSDDTEKKGKVMFDSCKHMAGIYQGGYFLLIRVTFFLIHLKPSKLKKVTFQGQKIPPPQIPLYAPEGEPLHRVVEEFADD